MRPIRSRSRNSQGPPNQHHWLIPKEIGNWTRLERLLVEDVLLSGTLPAEIGQMLNLGALSLENTRLHGQIPTEVGYLTNLRHLALPSNRFSGSLPSELANMGSSNTRTHTIDLSNNMFTGMFPAEMAYAFSRHNWLWLLLHGNNFSGDLDFIFCQPNRTSSPDIFSADCAPSPVSMAAVSCSCCTECYVAKEDTFYQHCQDPSCVMCGFNRTARSCQDCEAVNRQGISFNETAITSQTICGNTDCCPSQHGGACVYNADNRDVFG